MGLHPLDLQRVRRAVQVPNRVGHQENHRGKSEESGPQCAVGHWDMLPADIGLGTEGIE